MKQPELDKNAEERRLTLEEAKTQYSNMLRFILVSALKQTGHYRCRIGGKSVHFILIP